MHDFPTGLSASNLAIHRSVSCYHPLNLVYSPNYTPVLNRLHYNTREGTSALGRESVNFTGELITKPYKDNYHETLKPPSACHLISSTFTTPDVDRSPVPSPHCLPLHTSRIVVSLAIICLYVCV